METKNFFEEGDIVVLTDNEKYKHPEVTPIGKVTCDLASTEAGVQYYYIEWESGEKSAEFPTDGKISKYTNMNELVINYGQIDEKAMLGLKLKI
jgi:hypothetical protein